MRFPFFLSANPRQPIFVWLRLKFVIFAAVAVFRLSFVVPTCGWVAAELMMIVGVWKWLERSRYIRRRMAGLWISITKKTSAKKWRRGGTTTITTTTGHIQIGTRWHYALKRWNGTERSHSRKQRIKYENVRCQERLTTTRPKLKIVTKIIRVGQQ